MVQLRDGSTTTDRRLARLVQFDERSRQYPIRETLDSGVQPRSYTWRCDTHLDQGPDGSCVGFSLTHELIGRPVCVQGLDATFAKEQVYWEAQKIDPWEGGSYPGANPQYEGTSVLAGVKVLQKLGYIEEYRWAFGLDDLLLAVGYKGPAVLGISWYDGMFNMMPCGQVHVTGQVAGGHAILCKGVSITKKTFTLHNSWGASWGSGGDALISWEEMGRLLQEQGEAVIPLKRAFGG